VTPLSIEEIDLRALVDVLRGQLGEEIVASYLRGKTVLRDTIAAHLCCSDAEAEDLVETLELQGFIRFPHLEDDTHPSGRRYWHIGAPAWS
jgi:hypothetical protein